MPSFISACVLGTFACINFSKKNKRLLAVESQTTITEFSLNVEREWQNTVKFVVSA